MQADTLGFDEMAVCPFVEEDLEALVAEVPSEMLWWFAHTVGVEAKRRGHPAERLSWGV